MKRIDLKRSDWEQCKDKLPTTNGNNLSADLRGICLKSQLFGRALDLCSRIPDDVIASNDGVAAIISPVHKLDDFYLCPRFIRIFRFSFYTT